MCSPKKPFAEFKNAVEPERAVSVQGVRPSIKKEWHTLLSDKIKKCWCNRLSERPAMESVKSVLREVKTSMSCGEDTGKKRRPTSPEQRGESRSTWVTVTIWVDKCIRAPSTIIEYDTL